MKTQSYKLPVSADPGHVSVEIYEPVNAFAVLTLGHGAGTNMHHATMRSLALALTEQGITTVRYNFPYTEKGRKMPDRVPTTTLTIRALLLDLHTRYPKLPIFGGGRSFGGRMTSNMQATEPVEFLKGIIFYGFPLHPANQPGVTRADHLQQVKIPMLFLSGSEDTLAYTPLLSDVCKAIPHATLTILQGTDHSFGKARAKNQELLCSHTVDWLQSRLNG